MYFLNDGVDKLVLLASRPTDIDAIEVSVANAGDDHSGSIVSPLPPFFADSSRFTFKTIDVTGNGERNGRTNASGTLRIVRHFDSDTLQPDTTDDATFTAFGTKGTIVRVLTRRGPKASGADFAAGDYYDYLEFETDTARKVDEDDQYIMYDVPLVFTGTYAANKEIVVDAN